MHSVTFALAALRLAPVQCAAWGHPTTTGHPTIDYYLSAAAMESADAASHYSERLVLLPGIGTQYAPPAIPADADRARFALPEGKVLLLCPQSLFKVHPDNDSLLASVLAATRNTMLVLFEGRHPALTDRFMRRLQAAFAAQGVAIRERAIVLPGLAHPDYLRVNRLCDAMLDTLHWSGGNTSLDALACGLPIVTLPGALMRGRQTAGMLDVIGVPDLIAADRDDYLRIACRLADDAAVAQRTARAHCARAGAAVRRSGADRAPAGVPSGSGARRPAFVVGPGGGEGILESARVARHVEERGVRARCAELRAQGREAFGRARERDRRGLVLGEIARDELRARPSCAAGSPRRGSPSSPRRRSGSEARRRAHRWSSCRRCTARCRGRGRRASGVRDRCRARRAA